MKTLEYRYQLPRFFREGSDRHIHQLFIFSGTTDEDVGTLAEESAACERLEKVEVKCEIGYSKETLLRYMEIFNEKFPTDRGIEIVFEANIPKIVLAQSLVMDRVTRGRRQALLN